MLSIGDTVKVKYPFSETFTEEYVVSDKQDTTCFLEGVESAFDEMYLEKVG